MLTHPVLPDIGSPVNGEMFGKILPVPLVRVLDRVDDDATEKPESGLSRRDVILLHDMFVVISYLATTYKATANFNPQQ